MKKVLHIDTSEKVPIYIQIVNSITDAIRRGAYKKGERLFSINELSNEYFLARDTVQKAYAILYNDGIITSVKGKGYYVNKTDLDVPFKVLLLFSKLSNYKKQIYQAFLDTLGRRSSVDIKIHHSSITILRDVVENHVKDYDYIVIMPNFYNDMDEARELMAMVPEEKLLILDNHIPYSQFSCSEVYQDFENDIINALEQVLDLLAKYRKLYLVFPSNQGYSPEIMCGFKKFCMQNDIANEIIAEVNFKKDIKAGEAFIIIEETDLLNVIKQTQQKCLRVGRDVGIISYNDSPLKEVLLDGITVISTDHAKMGETAARMIKENKVEKVKNPCVIIRRNSL